MLSTASTRAGLRQFWICSMQVLDIHNVHLYTSDIVGFGWLWRQLGLLLHQIHFFS
jgi:hypothetical protein